MTTVEIANLALAVIGIIVASASYAHSTRIGGRSNRIANEAAKLASDQASLRRALKSDVLHRLISIYQNIDDFNGYLWQVLKQKHSVARDFVAEFCMRKVSELSDIRSTASYFEYTKAIRTFMTGEHVTAEQITECMEGTYFSGSSAESVGKQIGGV